MNERERRIARARLLRREGKTYDEIRAVIGPVDDSTLRIWCKGIPRPPETYRSHTKAEVRAQARRLRAAGLTYDEIAERLKVSKSSLSFWLRGQPGPDRKPHSQAEHLKRIQPLGARGRMAHAAAARAGRSSAAFSALDGMTDRELLVAGVALYISEGSKAKPWRPLDRQITFLNSDASVMIVFLAWLDLLGIPEGRRSYRLSIHESADVATQEQWWATTLGLDPNAFMRATLKHHNPKTVRKNVKLEYHGCLIVRVRKPAALYDAVEGWWQRLVYGRGDP